MRMPKKSKSKQIGALNRPMVVNYSLLHTLVMVSIIAKLKNWDKSKIKKQALKPAFLFILFRVYADL